MAIDKDILASLDKGTFTGCQGIREIKNADEDVVRRYIPVPLSDELMKLWFTEKGVLKVAKPTKDTPTVADFSDADGNCWVEVELTEELAAEITGKMPKGVPFNVKGHFAIGPAKITELTGDSASFERSSLQATLVAIDDKGVTVYKASEHGIRLTHSKRQMRGRSNATSVASGTDTGSNDALKAFLGGMANLAASTSKTKA